MVSPNFALRERRHQILAARHFSWLLRYLSGVLGVPQALLKRTKFVSESPQSHSTHLTLLRVFNAAVDLIIETSFSHTGRISGDNVERKSRSPWSNFSQISIRYCSLFKRWGEYESFPLSRVVRMRSSVCSMLSRSLVL
jgi:hypothetical protein